MFDFSSIPHKLHRLTTVPLPWYCWSCSKLWALELESLQGMEDHLAPGGTGGTVTVALYFHCSGHDRFGCWPRPAVDCWSREGTKAFTWGVAISTLNWSLCQVTRLEISWNPISSVCLHLNSISCMSMPLWLKGGVLVVFGSSRAPFQACR